MNQLLFIDLETTGLIPERHAIIDICLVLTDVKGTELTRFNSKINPTAQQLDDADPRAMKVNGYYERQEEWEENAIESYQVEAAIGSTFDGYFSQQTLPDGSGRNRKQKILCVGWNVPFDIGFFNRNYSFSNWTLGYHGLDLLSLGWDHLHEFLVDESTQLPRSIHLEDLCKVLNVDVDNNLRHTAEGDVNLYLECYKKLVNDWE